MVSLDPHHPKAPPVIPVSHSICSLRTIPAGNTLQVKKIQRRLHTGLGWAEQKPGRESLDLWIIDAEIVGASREGLSWESRSKQDFQSGKGATREQTTEMGVQGCVCVCVFCKWKHRLVQKELSKAWVSRGQKRVARPGGQEEQVEARWNRTSTLSHRWTSDCFLIRVESHWGALREVMCYRSFWFCEDHSAHTVSERAS